MYYGNRTRFRFNLRRFTWGVLFNHTNNYIHKSPKPIVYDSLRICQDLLLTLQKL